MKETIHHPGWEAQLRVGNQRQRTCRLFTAPARVPGLPGSKKEQIALGGFTGTGNPDL